MLDIFATNRVLNFTTSIPSLVCLGILCFKTDDVFILMQIKPFFARKVLQVHLTLFWKEELLELGNGLLIWKKENIKLNSHTPNLSHHICPSSFENNRRVAHLFCCVFQDCEKTRQSWVSSVKGQPWSSVLQSSLSVAAWESLSNPEFWIKIGNLTR